MYREPEVGFSKEKYNRRVNEAFEPGLNIISEVFELAPRLLYLKGAIFVDQSLAVGGCFVVHRRVSRLVISQG